MLNIAPVDFKSFLFMENFLIDVNQPRESLGANSLSPLLVKKPKEYQELLNQEVDPDAAETII